MEEYYDGVVAKPDLDELYHHGILGMHWGQRNGPPYPLGSDVSTGHRLKSGAAGSISKTKKKLAKASAKAAKANKKAAKASNSLLHPVMNYHKNAYQSKAFKTQAKVDKLQKKLVKEENKERNRRAKEYLDKYSNEVVDYGEDGKMTRKEWIKFSEDTVNDIDKRNPGFKKWLDDTYPDRSEYPVTEYNKYEREYEEIKNDATKTSGETFGTIKRVQDWGAFENKLNADPEYVKASKKHYELERELEAYDVGEKSEPRNQKKIDELATQLKDVNSEVNKIYDTIKSQHLAQEHRESINRRLQNAKTLDQWDLNFLEATQNAPWTEAHIIGEMSDSAYKNKMLQEYKKYLEDPEKYWKNR